MAVEDLHDLGVLDADHALRPLGVIDEQRAPRLRIDQVRALDRALPGTVIRLPRAHGVRATGALVGNGYLDVHRIA